MADIKIEVKDERTITVPKTASAADTETVGKFLLNAGQDGYGIKSVSAITREEGTQRDPYTVTLGVKITVAKT